MQGKETYLKSAGDLLRTMRTASRTKIPSLLKKMNKQVSRIAGITELSDELRSNLEDVSNSVRSLLEQIGESHGKLPDKIPSWSSFIVFAPADDPDSSRSGTEETPRSEESTYCNVAFV